ncbi:hypothetical protein C942_00222 [Photobacterium marinum]|uniref:Cystatin domain-containing protein n=2 Tax=Photobacterium TaxID=657 RepID=L8JK84_9GAMM|nr:MULTISPECIES: hypothetical protein [Photobacterium]ELR67914.1 hypothetical protein C942_00222 [Photobacterium marinum]
MNNIAGGWTPYSTHIDDEMRHVFDQAMEGLLGVSYEPFAVSTQIVAGVNYHFLCNAKVADREGTEYAVMVTISELINAKPVINEIHKI